MCATCGASHAHPLARPQAEPGSKIQLGRVLALKHGGKFNVGQPWLEGVRVEAEVLEELKGPKVGGRVWMLGRGWSWGGAGRAWMCGWAGAGRCPWLRRRCARSFVACM